MKITTHILVLFFAFFMSVSAQTTNNYGLVPLKIVVGATHSVDGRWIKFNGSLYYDMESLRKDLVPPVLFEKKPDIVGAKATLDNEFVYYGSSNFQKFRPDWKPIMNAQVTKTTPNYSMIIGLSTLTGILLSLSVVCRPFYRRT